VKAILMLIPVALTLGAIGLVAFLWSLRSGQFEDLDGAANRILFDYDDPITPQPPSPPPSEAADKDPSEAADKDPSEAADKEKDGPKP